jgi:hypothetical protein
VKGREAIFWQTQKTARAANPGGRIPRRRALADAVTIAGRHEGARPLPLRPASSETVRATVPAGGYPIHAPDGSLLAAVERKRLENLAATLSDGTLAFQLQRLAELPLAAVVVEARYSALYKLNTCTAAGLPTSLPGSRSATPKSTSSSPTPAASPKSEPTASSPQHSLTRPTRARTANTLNVVDRTQCGD